MGRRCFYKICLAIFILALWLYLYRGKLLWKTPIIVEMKSDSESFLTKNTIQLKTTEEVGEKTEKQIISTCSLKSDGRGFGQKVVGFSIYGSLADPGIFSRYVTPLKTVVDRITELYPSTYRYT